MAKKTDSSDTSDTSDIPDISDIPEDIYRRELDWLQTEMAKMTEWVRADRTTVVVIFEGRDAVGKGGAIKRMTEYVSPRVVRVVALPVPSDGEKGQWYFQRYIAQLPTAGEGVLFDRSWYDRAGVEWVMGFCTPDEYRRFLQQCPTVERQLIDDGILPPQIKLGKRLPRGTTSDRPGSCSTTCRTTPRRCSIAELTADQP